jgi:hypothetical protein
VRGRKNREGSKTRGRGRREEGQRMEEEKTIIIIIMSKHF